MKNWKRVIALLMALVLVVLSVVQDSVMCLA